MKDNEIIDLYFERNQAAISETADKYGAYLNAIALNILHCEEDAEETVSDTYFRAWNAMPPTRPNVLRHFLSRITRNLSFDRLRHNSGKYSQRQTLELLDEFDECIPDRAGSAEDALEARELGRLLNSFLSQQEKTDARLFVLRYYYALSISAIAERTALTERQVKYRLSCTRHSLKNYLETEGMIP